MGKIFSRWTSWLLVAGLLWMAYPASSTTPVRAQAESRLEAVTCRFPDATHPRLRRRITCYDLTVPEDHAKPQGKAIKLHVAVIRAREKTAQADPIVYLAGGPGASSLASLLSWTRTDLIETRDFITFDQRGTGFSEPTLHCPNSRSLDSYDVDGAPLCRLELISKRVNLSVYNSAQSAADLDQLRQALGIAQWNVYGISYGTRLALTAMRDFPTGIRSAVLDGVYPPEVQFVESNVLNGARALKQLFEGCAANRRCNRSYPDLENTFFDVYDTLNGAPVIYNGIDGNGDPVERQMSGFIFYARIRLLLYVSEAIPELPKAIAAVADGEPAALDQLEYGLGLTDSTGLVQEKPPRADKRLQDADGVWNSVQCAEEIPFNSLEQVQQALDDSFAFPDRERFKAQLYAQADSVMSLCKIWKVTLADARETKRVESDIPTLLFSGSYDPITPPAWAESAAEGLSTSYSLLFEDGGHGQTNDCAQTMMLAFLDDPSKRPSTTCLRSHRAPAWDVQR